MLYAFEIFDFMTRSWNTTLYPFMPLPDCAADAFSASCYAALKHKYLGNLAIAEACLAGLFLELVIVRFASRKRLSAIFGKPLFLAAFIVSAVILCIHTIARFAAAIIGVANSNSSDGLGIYLGLYIVTVPILTTIQCIALGAANFPAPHAKGREIGLSASRLVFMATSALIPLVHAGLKYPIDDYGFLLWGALTYSTIIGMLREGAARG